MLAVQKLASRALKRFEEQAVTRNSLLTFELRENQHG
jgi:hypothetical protein